MGFFEGVKKERGEDRFFKDLFCWKGCLAKGLNVGFLLDKEGLVIR